MQTKKTTKKKVTSKKKDETKENGKTAYGRKRDYDTKIKPFLDIIKVWVSEGVSEKDMMANLGIVSSTWYDYKANVPEFSSILNKQKEICVGELKNTYYQSALGKLKSTKVVKERLFDKETGKYKMVVVKEEISDIPPNTKALAHLLALKDKTYSQKALIDLGGSLNLSLNTDFKNMSNEDIENRIAALEAELNE